MNSVTFDKVLVVFFLILLVIFIYNYFSDLNSSDAFTNEEEPAQTKLIATKFPTPTPEVTNENYHPEDKNDVKQFLPSVRDKTSQNYIDYIFGTRTYKD
jgi:hypothetical protein